MIPLQIFQQSKTTLLLSRYLMPLLGLAGLATAAAIAMYALVLYPAQTQFEQASVNFRDAQQINKQTQVAKQTQVIINTTWKGLSNYREFTDLSLEIADLAKHNHVSIPGMGYDFKPLSNKLAAKGTFGFEAQGKYASIRKFIYELEKRWPYLFIEKLSVERSKKNRGVIFRMTVSTFLKEFPQNLKKSKA